MRRGEAKPLSEKMWIFTSTLSGKEPQTATMSALRRRMIDDMMVRNLSPATQQSYIYAVRRFSEYLNQSPAAYGKKGPARVWEGARWAWDHVEMGTVTPNDKRLVKHGPPGGGVFVWGQKNKPAELPRRASRDCGLISRKFSSAMVLRSLRENATSHMVLAWR